MTPLFIRDAATPDTATTPISYGEPNPSFFPSPSLLGFACMMEYSKKGRLKYLKDDTGLTESCQLNSVKENRNIATVDYRFCLVDLMGAAG